jgi:glycosyltransferase involved in cell wall biosynthesis
MRICQVVASINRDTGGPALTVPRLAAALEAVGLESSVASLDYPEHGSQTSDFPIQKLTTQIGAVGRVLRGWSPAFQRQLSAFVRDDVRVVHSHGLWMFPNLYARRAAIEAKIPFVISPRGMVEHWSLSRSRWKKALAWNAFERGNLSAASLFHATSADEVGSLQSLGFRKPIALIPNGIDLPELGAAPGRQTLESRFAGLKDVRWLLFMSRLHPKKGVAELLQVWSTLHAQFPDWHLVVAGPDLDGYGDTLRQLTATLNLSRHVTFTGPLSGSDKECALANADLFVLPTHSENFGVAVAEALAYGIPAVTTKGAPWEDLQTSDCGLWIDFGEDSLAAALGHAMRRSPEERKAMGNRGRTLMQQKYSWGRVGHEMKSVYLWLCGAGPQPPCVATS